MKAIDDASGFTLTELLVAMALFSVLSVGFYQVMFSGVRGGDTTRDVVEVSAEARLGLNRMIRETREADSLACPVSGPCATSSTYTINIDFNGDGQYSTGDYEVVNFSHDPADDSLTISAGSESAALSQGIFAIPGQDVFSYSSTRLEYDANRDGITTWQELDSTAGVGNGNGELDSPEVAYINVVTFALRVVSATRSADFYSEAQLRNRR